MKFSQILGQLLKKRPSLSEGEALQHMTSNNLISLLKQVYEQGVKMGMKKEQDRRSIVGSHFDMEGY